MTPVIPFRQLWTQSRCKRKGGFWLVGGLLTLIYAAVFGLLAYFISEHDPIGGWVIFALVFLVVGALHLLSDLDRKKTA